MELLREEEEELLLRVPRAEESEMDDAPVDGNLHQSTPLKEGTRGGGGGEWGCLLDWAQSLWADEEDLDSVGLADDEVEVLGARQVPRRQAAHCRWLLRRDDVVVRHGDLLFNPSLSSSSDSKICSAGREKFRICLFFGLFYSQPTENTPARGSG